MNEKLLSMLRSPISGQPLHQTSIDGVDALATKDGAEQYLIKDGIPVLTRAMELSDKNGRYRKLYDDFSHLYDFAMNVGWSYMGVKESDMRRELLEEVREGSKGTVLEVSIGTGGNIRTIDEGKDYYGIDISLGMLKQCRKNQKHWNRDVSLVCSEAESIPFQDESFDAVFHFGGFNFFNDRAKAMQEMVRVAKPGAKVVIIDETEEAAKSIEEFPRLKAFYKERDPIEIPSDLIPPGVSNKVVKELFEGRLFYVSFEK